jgi:hypothetical protein
MSNLPSGLSRGPRVQRLDPNSERGKQVAHDLGVLFGGVINRLRREGRPIPGQPIEGEAREGRSGHPS